VSIGADLRKIFLEPLGKSLPISRMKKCKACGAEISTLADACPKCGQPSAAKQAQAVGCLLVIIGLASILFFLFVL